MPTVVPPVPIATIPAIQSPAQPTNEFRSRVFQIQRVASPRNAGKRDGDATIFDVNRWKGGGDADRDDGDGHVDHLDDVDATVANDQLTRTAANSPAGNRDCRAPLGILDVSPFHRSHRVQHVRNETAHLDGGAYRAIEKEKGPEERGKRVRLELQLSEKSKRQQITLLTSGDPLVLCLLFGNEKGEREGEQSREEVASSLSPRFRGSSNVLVFLYGLEAIQLDDTDSRLRWRSSFLRSLLHFPDSSSPPSDESI